MSVLVTQCHLGGGSIWKL